MNWGSTTVHLQWQNSYQAVARNCWSIRFEYTIKSWLNASEWMWEKKFNPFFKIKWPQYVQEGQPMVDNHSFKYPTNFFEWIQWSKRFAALNWFNFFFPNFWVHEFFHTFWSIVQSTQSIDSFGQLCYNNQRRSFAWNIHKCIEFQ